MIEMASDPLRNVFVHKSSTLSHIQVAKCGQKIQYIHKLKSKNKKTQKKKIHSL